MDKIIVEIFVPALNITKDILIPTNIQMYKVIIAIEKILTELTNGRYLGNETILCYRDDGGIVDANHSAGELGLKNGSRLMII